MLAHREASVSKLAPTAPTSSLYAGEMLAGVRRQSLTFRRVQTDGVSNAALHGRLPQRANRYSAHIPSHGICQSRGPALAGPFLATVLSPRAGAFASGAGVGIPPSRLTSHPNSLIPCSNSANSLICGNYFPVPANSFPCSVAQGISPQAIESARPAPRHPSAIYRNSLLFSLFAK